MKFLIGFFILFNTNLTFSNELESYLKYCLKGAAVTEGYLKKDNDVDSTRLILRCKGGTVRTLEDYSKELHKNEYACGVGIGAALNFHSRSELLQNKKVMLSLLESCLN